MRFKVAGQTLRKFLVHFFAMQSRIVTFHTGQRRSMSLNVTLDTRHFHMGFLAFKQGFGNIAMAAGTIIIGNRIPVSYLFGRMGGMTAFAIGQYHCFGVGLMTAEAFRRFSMRGMAFEAIQFGM